MDGFEATRAIRRLDAQRNCHTPVVACTARSLPGDREAGFAAGMDEYLIKPIPADLIEAQVRRWVRGVRPAPTPSVPVSARMPTIAPPATNQPPTASSDTPLLEREVLDRIGSYGGNVLERTTTMFLSELDERIGELAALDRTGDLETLAKRAHALKGAAGSLGAKQLWQRLAKLEALAKSRDATGARTICDGLPSVAGETTAAMRNYLKQP
jgi:CheY-like chemotaxis protein